MTQSFEIFTENWQNFLFRIERAWESIERTLKQVKGYQQWIKPYKALRKKDPLLIYLKQARNTETHGLGNSVEKSLNFYMKDKLGRDFTPNMIQVKLEDGVLVIDINTNEVEREFLAELLPTSPKLMDVVNRGQRYRVPWKHLKSELENIHPVYIAQLGLAFYKSLAVEAENWIKDRG